jgi:hypothetical protein
MRALDKYRAALDASQTGCGKTPVAVKIAFDYDFPTLIVAPKTAVPMWEEELEDSGISEWYVINYEKLRANGTEWGHWIDKAKKIWKWNLPATTLLIWDEVQKAKGMNTQNARMLWAAKPYRNLMLSATAAKDPTEMKALGFLLGLHRLRDFWKWSMRYGCKPGMFGGLEFDGEPEDLDNLHKLIFPDHGSRLTTADLADHFTETQIIMTPLDFGAEVQAAYAEMDRELAALAAAKATDSKGAEALTIRLRARQKVELLKVPEMVDRTEDLVAEGRSVALFVNFTATIDALRARFSMPSGVVSGAHGDRQKHIKAFQADEIRVIVCNIQAGGLILNLQDLRGVYPRTSLISPNDNEKDIIQVIGRIHRAAGLTPTQQHVLFAANTIEEAVKDNCMKKMANVDIFNEGLKESVDE